MSWYLPRCNGENYENPQSQWPMFLPTLRLCTCRMQISSVFVYWPKLHDVNVCLAPYGNAYCVKKVMIWDLCLLCLQKYLNGNCRTILMRSEVVVIVWVCCFDRMGASKRPTSAFILLCAGTLVLLWRTPNIRENKSTCENFKIRFKLSNNGSL
jgi:hypothetical protein